MSIADVNIIMERIKGAEPDSPMVVYLVPGCDLLDAQFAGTILNAKRILMRDVGIVGVFHRRNDLEQVRFQLLNAQATARRLAA